METLLYLYGIVPGDAPDPGPDLVGIDDGPVRLIRAGRLGALVGLVDAAAYSDEVLNERLADLAWVGLRGLAHERVLDDFTRKGPVIPLSLFSLHRDEARILERLAGETERYERVLERLRGRREFGVKLWREDARLTDRLHELSPPLRALQVEIEAAPPGKAFLLGRKREGMQAEELRRVSARVSHEVYASLRQEAERSTTVTLPANPPQTGRTLLLHAAFLLPDDAFGTFQGRLGEMVATFGPLGFDLEFSGPWPAYHFTDPDGT